MRTVHARRLMTALLSAYGALLLTLAMTWDLAGYFSEHNLFFNSDPESNLASLAQGTWGRLAPSHPGLELLSLPIRVLAQLVSLAWPTADVIRLRELLALSYSPVATLLTLVVTYRALMHLGLSAGDARAGTAVFAASFSTLIFGVLPETYALSGLCVALLLLRVIEDTGVQSEPRHVWWAATGLAAALVTITHAVTAGLLYGAMLWHHRRTARAATIRATAMTTGIVATGLCMHVLMLRVFDVDSGDEGQLHWIAQFVSLDPARIGLNVLSFPLASLQAIAAFGATVGPRPLGVSGSRLGLTFTIEAVTPVALGALAVVALGAAWAWRRLRDDPLRKRLALPLALVLLSNLALHAVFGDEVFLYSKHWMGATALLFLPLLAGHSRLAWGLTTVMLFHNLRVLLGAPGLIED